MNRDKQNRSRWVKPVLYTSLAALLTGAFFGGRFTVEASGPPSVRVPVLFRASGALKSSTTLHKETVLALGGSIAFGWRDPSNDSYLERAFAGLTSSTNVDYDYVNHAVVGLSTPDLINKHLPDYQDWLNTLKPDVVVVSFGLLSDISQKTPTDVFDADLKKTISMALAKHAMVIVVTPPVTKAAYTALGTQVNQYIADEKQIVQSFHTKNVRFFDLYNQMMDYLAAHHETYEPYSGDNWHPNMAGHILAGDMLQNDLVTVFGQDPITYQK